MPLMNATSNKKRVLIVLPHQGYDEEQFRTTWVSLRNRAVECKVASTSKEKAVGGIDYFFPDFTLEEVDTTTFDGVVFIGGEGADSLADQPKAQEIAKKVSAQGGVVGGIGRGVGALAKAHLLKGLRSTGDPQLKAMIEQLGAKYTGGQVEPRWLHGNPRKIVTALDAGATFLFGRRILSSL